MLILLKVYKNLISFKLLIAALQREEGKVILCLIELFKNLPPFVLDVEINGCFSKLEQNNLSLT